MIKLRKDLEISNKELSERTLQLSQLRKRTYYNILWDFSIITKLFYSYTYFTVSEAMYKEYDQLKQQYELETGTLHKAMERASQVIN